MLKAKIHYRRGSESEYTETKEFRSLLDLENFIFENAGFVKREEGDPVPDVYASEATGIRFNKSFPGERYPRVFIRTIQDGNGAYIFSDGKLTADKKICEEPAGILIEKINKRKDSFTFGGSEKIFIGDFLAPDQIREIAWHYENLCHMQYLQDMLDELQEEEQIPHLSEEEKKGIVRYAFRKYTEYLQNNELIPETEYSLRSVALEEAIQKEGVPV